MSSRDPLPRFHKLFRLASKDEDDGERASARQRVVELVNKHPSVDWTQLIPRLHRNWAFESLGPNGEDCRTCRFEQGSKCFRYPAVPTAQGSQFPDVYLGLSWCGEWGRHKDCAT